MKFSVIIPVYNVEPYLRTCLDSVLGQTCADWEAICIDDGSTDGGGEILDDYAAEDSRFRVVHQQNAGLGPARNVGLDLAQGDYVLFLDSDDSLIPECLQYLYELNEKVNADLVQYALVRTTDFDENIPLVDKGYSLLCMDTDESLRRGARRVGSMIACSCLWRRSKIGDCRFYSIQPGEDLLFAAGMIQRVNRIASTQTILYRYYQRPGSTMNRHRGLPFVLNHIKVLSLICDEFKKWAKYASVRDILERWMRNEFRGVLLVEIAALSSSDKECAFSRYFDLGRVIFNNGLFVFAFRWRSKFLLRMFNWDWRVRAYLLKFNFVRWLKNWARQ